FRDSMRKWFGNFLGECFGGVLLFLPCNVGGSQGSAKEFGGRQGAAQPPRKWFRDRKVVNDGMKFKFVPALHQNKNAAAIFRLPGAQSVAQSGEGRANVRDMSLSAA